MRHLITAEEFYLTESKSKLMIPFVSLQSQALKIKLFESAEHP
jgi:hypothetical protein